MSHGNYQREKALIDLAPRGKAWKRRATKKLTDGNDPIGCTKAKFGSEEKALARIAEIAEHNAELSRKSPGRAYECSRCGKFHLTSQPLPP